MTVRLRGHHLLCMLTYVGRGYTPAFTANFNAIAARLSEGEDILLVDGPDDICAPLLAEDDTHCFGESASRRDRTALATAGRQLALQLRIGTRLCLTPAILANLREAFSRAVPADMARAGLRRACAGCDWAALCTGIAERGYDGALVRMTGRVRLPRNRPARA